MSSFNKKQAYDYPIEKENTLKIQAPYFTEFTCLKGSLYILCIMYVTSVSILSILQPFFLDVCEDNGASLHLDFANPKYDQRICTRTRTVTLLYLTPEECSFGRRIVIAASLGGLIGWERRSADRPAGIRTMSLVSLGACLFSICSAFAFIEGPMGWDGSRVAAAIPSGVGFLGAGIIWKQASKDGEQHTVHGLTTAASIWLSAAVGIACSGELYFAASFSVAIMLLLLRFGPRLSDDDGSSNYGSTTTLDNLRFHGDIESSRSALARNAIQRNVDEYGATNEKDDHVTLEELQCLQNFSVDLNDPTSPGSTKSISHNDYGQDYGLDLKQRYGGTGVDSSGRVIKKKSSTKKKRASLME